MMGISSPPPGPGGRPGGRSGGRAGVVVACLLLVLAGAASVAAGRWVRPLLDAEDAVSDGRPDAALAGFGAAEARLQHWSLSRRLFAGEQATAVYNQLALLYEMARYDAVLEKVATAPPEAAPHYWAGMALFAIAMQQEERDARLLWFGRAEEEFRRALEDAPGDWDTRYNYELAARLAAALRKQPKLKSDTPMQLLRPESKPADPPKKVG